MMKAIAYETFGAPDVLELKDVPTPEVAHDQVLVRVRAASPNPWDWHYLRGVPYVARLQGMGLRRPKKRILGGDVAGEVEAVGAAVTNLRPGERVYGFVGGGGFAEFVAAREGVLAPMPKNLSFQEAATVPLAALTALQGLRDVGEVRAGQRVLIIGASGGVGTFAVQVAKWLDADVTGVCSARNVELVRDLGADDVLDYTREDVTRSGRTFDVVFQLAGTASPLALRRVLRAKGRLVQSSGDASGRVVAPLGRVLGAVLLSPFVGQTLRPLFTKIRRDDLALVTDLIEAGTIRPVIDRTYPLQESAEAIRYLETGRARGKVAIVV